MSTTVHWIPIDYILLPSMQEHYMEENLPERIVSYQVAWLPESYFAVHTHTHNNTEKWQIVNCDDDICRK
jgi:hypothetical protein